MIALDGGVSPVDMYSSTHEDPLIDVRGVSKVFSDDTHPYTALSDCDLQVRDGEFVSLLGPSGCGKSTLLYIIAGFEAPTTGAVSLRGELIRRPSRERVLCFQDAMQALLPWQDVRANVSFALELGKKPKSEHKAIIDKHLATVGLLQHEHKFPVALSGGMKQRLQLARALAADPAVLLMDEPFGALDAMTRRQMHDELLSVWESTKKAIVFVTHDIAEALKLSDRIAIMCSSPKARVVELLEVDIPRPRHETHPRFGELFEHIDNTLHQQGGTGHAA